jgi:shikimate kinase
MTPKVVLVGLPGAGKSTSGRRLAKILGVPFADSDDLVEQAAGCTVREIFDRSGEEAFRSAEGAAVTGALSQFDGVLALGGGALTAQTTREAVRRSGVDIAYLRTTLETLAGRIGDGHTRPLLAEDPSARLAELAAEREPVYAELASITVDTDGRSPGQVAATVAARLHDRGVA